MTAARPIDHITVTLLRVPLAKPYRLSFGTVEHYDTIVAEVVDCDGRSGLGEATVLTGYTDETIADAWHVARQAAATLAATPRADAAGMLDALATTHPFTATAFGTAYEMLDGSRYAEVARSTPVPLIGLLSATDEPAMAGEFDRLLADGYRTVKVKVGFDVERDIALVRAAQRVNAGRALIRLDANQGYTAEQGVRFVRAIPPDGIELFEQPCAAGDWESHRAVAAAASVPLMLDESIYGLADIEKAARLRCADYIKVKLMKLVTLEALARCIARIRELGMKPVLGNGVACDLGCWLEALVAARHIDNAGEMNGFLKPLDGVLAQPLRFRDGALLLEPGYEPRLDPDRVARFRLDAATAFPRAARTA